MANQTTKDQVRCSFCGKSERECHRLIEGPGVYICDECIEFCSSLIAPDDIPTYKQPKKEKEEAFELPVPAEIKAALDEYVIGQDEAKISLAVAAADGDFLTGMHPQNAGNMLSVGRLQGDQIAADTVFCYKKAHGSSPRIEIL